MIIISTAAAVNARDDMTEEQKQLVMSWLDFCHRKDVRRRAAYVDYSTVRNIGRWGAAPRAKPWVVRSAVTLDVLSTCKTFEGAMQAAERWSRCFESFAAK